MLPIRITDEEKEDVNLLPSKTEHKKSEIAMLPIKKKSCGHYEPCENIVCDITLQQYVDKDGVSPMLALNIEEDEINAPVEKHCSNKYCDALSIDHNRCRRALIKLHRCDKSHICDICGITLKEWISRIYHRNCTRKKEYVHNNVDRLHLLKERMRMRELQILEIAKMKKHDYSDPARAIETLRKNEELIIIPQTVSSQRPFVTITSVPNTQLTNTNLINAQSIKNNSQITNTFGSVPLAISSQNIAISGNMPHLESNIKSINQVRFPNLQQNSYMMSTSVPTPSRAPAPIQVQLQAPVSDSDSVSTSTSTPTSTSVPTLTLTLAPTSISGAAPAPLSTSVPALALTLQQNSYLMSTSVPTPTRAPAPIQVQLQAPVSDSVPTSTPTPTSTPVPTLTLALAPTSVSSSTSAPVVASVPALVPVSAPISAPTLTTSARTSVASPHKQYIRLAVSPQTTTVQPTNNWVVSPSDILMTTPIQPKTFLAPIRVVPITNLISPPSLLHRKQGIPKFCIVAENVVKPVAIQPNPSSIQPVDTATDTATGQVNDSKLRIHNPIPKGRTKTPKLMKAKKNFFCVYCSKNITTDWYFKMHIAKHKGEKLFFCSFCDESFSNNYDMKKHITNQHTGQKELTCNKCNYTCTSLISFKSHVQTHAISRLNKADIQSKKQKKLKLSKDETSHKLIHKSYERKIKRIKCEDTSDNQNESVEKHDNEELSTNDGSGEGFNFVSVKEIVDSENFKQEPAIISR